MYHLDLCLVWYQDLQAYYLAQKYQPQLIQPMKLVYEDEFARALAEDGSASSISYMNTKSILPRSIMAKYATGKYARAISDRSGMEFPYKEMVREWNGSFVHVSEFEPKATTIRTKTYEW